MSDGLSAVSVYRVLRPTNSEIQPTAQRLDRMGPLNAYSRSAGDVQVTVVGEVPRHTIKMIGDNLEAAQGQQDLGSKFAAEAIDAR